MTAADCAIMPMRRPIYVVYRKRTRSGVATCRCLYRGWCGDEEALRGEASGGCTAARSAHAIVRLSKPVVATLDSYLNSLGWLMWFAAALVVKTLDLLELLYVSQDG
jgi:hypothetical protein